MPEQNPRPEIPNTYHFIWLGSPIPFFLVLAIQSVLARCKGARVKLWMDKERMNDPQLTSVSSHPRFETKEVYPEELISTLDLEPAKKRIKEIFNTAGSNTLHADRKPVERSRSNLLRYLILYQEGGVYLDADTIVTQDLAPLRTASSAFIGRENSIWAITRRKNPLHYFLWAPFLEILRFVAIMLPSGYKLNRTFSVMCGASENNAVIGMTPKHNFMKSCFEYILTMDNKEIALPLRLGPFLLQRVAQGYTQKDLEIYPEPYFYPYGPMISQHFFKRRGNAEAVSAYMLGQLNYVVHWGASTKVLKSYTKDAILHQEKKSVFYLLASKVLRDYEDEKH